MASGCIIPNLDTTRYSSPVPVIGLYIAAGSSVCLLLMLFDIISAYRRSQSWIPCRFFKINSFSLTLLAIASKLQVDLTTPMPGVPDQLSKLTGTTLLCICMGFFNPSVGNNGHSEYLSNMAALSIMVITVVVNICIQFYTGVIHLFIPEHIMMMCCMFVVLFLMWYCAHETKLRNHLDIEFSVSPMTKYGSGSLFARLASCYAHGFDKSTQLRACRRSGNLLLVPFCLVCFCVLVQATVRSVVLKKLRFCAGGSDYDWSTWLILITQSLTIVVGCLAICFRWFTSFSHMHIPTEFEDYVEHDESMAQKFISILGIRSGYKFGIYLQTSLWILAYFLHMLVLLPLTNLFQLFGGKFHVQDEFPDIVLRFLSEVPPGDHSKYPCNCTLEKVVNDIQRCVEESNPGMLKEVLELILRTSPSPQLRNIFKERNMASPLAIAALIKTAISCLPDSLTGGLVTCFHQAMDILQIGIDSKDPGYEVFMRNPLFVSKRFNDRLVFVFNYLRQSQVCPSSLLYANLFLDYIRVDRNDDYCDFVDIIKAQKYDTVEELYCVIEQLFVDMLHLSLSEIPNTIIKMATERPMDEHKDRVRNALLALLKIMPVEDCIEWSFPEKYGISGLTPRQPQAEVTYDHNNSIEVSSSHLKNDSTKVDASSSSSHHVTKEIEEV